MLTKQVLVFCGLAFLISWAIFFILLLLGAFNKPTTFAIGAILFMFGPALSAFICACIFDKGHVVETLALRPKFDRWMGMAWLVPVGVCLVSVLISLFGNDIHLISLSDGLRETGAIPKDMALPKYIDIILVVQAALLGAMINGILLISEELGWRGYLWNKLIDHGFWKTSLFTGIVWGFWHAPLIYMGHNYPSMPIAGIFLMVIFTLLLSPIIGYIRLRNGSVWAASLFHGTINALAGLTIVALASQNGEVPVWWKGILGIGGTLTLVAGCIWVYFSLRNFQNSEQKPQ